MTLRVLFFGNSESVFSNRHFQALLETPCVIAGVVDVPPNKRSSTNTRAREGAGFVASAHERGIPAFEPTSSNAPEFVNVIRALAPDLFIAVVYMNRLKPEILAVPRILAANFHASLLPAYRGKHPLFWALRNGERSVGLTVHVMDPSFDTGDILYQIRVRTRKTDTVGSAYDRVMARSVPLVGRLIADAETGPTTRLRRTPQATRGASYYSSVGEEDFRLDWSRDAKQHRRWIQTSPGQCFCDIAGRRVFFMDAAVVPRKRSAVAGTLIEIGRKSVTIAAGKRALRVRKVRVGQEDVRSAGEVFRELGWE